VKELYSDVKKINLVWHYLLFDMELFATWTDAQLENLKYEIASLITTIEKDTIFKPMESAFCGWCEFPLYCPAKKHERKAESLPVNEYLKETGVSLVNQYAKTKQT
jgi:putative RecB family exonuclease